MRILALGLGRSNLISDTGAAHDAAMPCGKHVVNCPATAAGQESYGKCRCDSYCFGGI